MSAVLSAELPRKAPVAPAEPLLTPEQAIEELAPAFRRAARRLWPKKARSMREDLVQEMNLACLGVRTPMPAGFYLTKALNHAIDWLIHEKRHDRLKLMPFENVCQIIEAGQRVTNCQKRCELLG